jgi:hypothetical protein
MSLTVSTRGLSKTDKHAILAIKIPNIETYRHKTGVFLLTIDSIAWGTGSGTTVANGCGTIITMPAKHLYDDPTINPIVPKINITNTNSSQSGTYKYVVTANNGAVLLGNLQGDGSVDVVYLKIDLTEDYPSGPGFVVTCTYDLAWTDLTPASPPGAATDTVSVSVGNSKQWDNAFIATDLGATFGIGCGYVLLQLYQLATTITQGGTPFPIPSEVAGDYALLQINTQAMAVGTAVTFQTGYASGTNGVRDFGMKECMVFAVNNGLVDENAWMLKNSSLQTACLAAIGAWKMAGIDNVQLQLSYKLTTATM